MLEFRILGPFEVVEGERRVVLGGPRQRALLAILVLRRREVISSDRLIDQLWGERPPATAAKTLQVYVSHLRKALGSGLLVTRNGGYLLAVAAGQVDAERFDALVADARRAMGDGDAAGARERLGSALDLWRGEAFADMAYEPFAQAEIARLEGARLGALEDRIDADLMLGHHRAVVGEAEALFAVHPHRERLLGQLMLALYRSGRHADALAAYRRGRRALRDDLGLEPGPELSALEQRVLTHDPALASPGPPASVADHAKAAPSRALIAFGGALLLAAAIAAGIAKLAGSGSVGLRAAPNSVAAIDAHTNRVVADVPVGARPSGVVFGSGSLWVANLDDQTVSRVDPRTLWTLRTLTVSGPPTGIAAGAGAVWVAAANPSANFVSVSRVDPQFDAIGRPVRLGTVVPGSPGAVVARAGSVWVAPSSGSLARLDAGTGRVAQQVDPNAAPAAIDAGAGAVWVTDSDAGTVTRVDPTGLVNALAVGHAPSGIAVGEGGLWVADTSDDAVVRIDPGTRAVTAKIPVGAAPVGVTVGAGSVWVANSGDGSVTRIDPNTDKPSATIAVGGSPQSIVVAGGRAWVTVDAQTLPAAGRAAGGGTARIDANTGEVGSLDPATAYGRVEWSCSTPPARSCSTTPTRPGWRDPSPCPRSPSRCPPAPLTARPTRSRSARASGSLRRRTRRSPPRRSSTRSSGASTQG